MEASSAWRTHYSQEVQRTKAGRMSKHSHESANCRTGHFHMNYGAHDMDIVFRGRIHAHRQAAAEEFFRKRARNKKTGGASETATYCRFAPSLASPNFFASRLINSQMNSFHYGDIFLFELVLVFFQKKLLFFYFY